jgi:hypothetical protein
MDDERIRRIKARAFELWQREGTLDGRSLSHWLQAEKEIDDEADESVAEDGPNPENLSEFAKSAKTST